MLRGMDWWTFEGADSSVASTWFGLRHARLKSCSPSTYSGFEIWVLRFRGLGASFSSLGCSVFEIWVLRFRDLGASCFGLRFRVLHFRNYPRNLHNLRFIVCEAGVFRTFMFDFIYSHNSYLFSGIS